MKKDKLFYELGVLMAYTYITEDNQIKDSLSSVIKSFEDDEICDEFLLKGMKNELEDTVTHGFEDDTDDVINEILEGYELNIDPFTMTIEDDEKVNKFFERKDLFLKVTDDYDLDDINPSEVLLFDDFKLAKDIANKNKNLHIYTLVDGDNGSAWIIDGWHYVNRQGYFFTTERIDIPEEGLRYW